MTLNGSLRTGRRVGWGRADSPRASFLTWGSSTGPFPRIAEALKEGFRELDERFDVVYLEGPENTESDGVVREVRLGVGNARRSIGSLFRYFRSARPGVTLVQPGYIAPFALVAGRMAGVPVVPWEPTFLMRDMPGLSVRMRILPALQRITYRLAPRIAVVSRGVGDEVVEALGQRVARRVRLVPNPVDVASLRAFRRDADGSSRRICAVGRLTYQKGFDVLIDAFAGASARIGSGWDLVILGEGPLRAELEKRAADRGVGGRVHFPGYRPNPYELMADSDVFVSSARWEGFGVALVEALALGVPVIATDCPGGPRDILAAGDDALLVESENPQALGDALARLTSDADLRKRLGRAGSETAERYSPRAVARLIDDLAREVEG